MRDTDAAGHRWMASQVDVEEELRDEKTLAARCGTAPNLRHI